MSRGRLRHRLRQFIARSRKPNRGRTTYSQSGDHVQIEYAPRPNGQADPGEVVWTWVPYEEDATQGKDRPVLILGRRHGRLVGLMLTSKDHDHDIEQARSSRRWMDVGTGTWDRQRRPSEVRLDRLIEVDATRVRREGAALDQRVFESVVEASRAYYG
jgi:PemK-like, MazF-like toxin of type II toxin-antitoxin system